MTVLDLGAPSGASTVWDPVFRLGDTLARGHKAKLITAAIGASGIATDRAALGAAYLAGRPQIDAWAETIDFAAAARMVNADANILTPFAVGVGLGCLATYFIVKR